MQTEKRLADCQKELDELIASKRRVEQFIKEGRSLLLVLEDSNSHEPNSTILLEKMIQGRRQY